MRPNRLVLPAPFGPTIPTVSPASTEKREIFRDDDAAEPLRHVVEFKKWSSHAHSIVGGY